MNKKIISGLAALAVVFAGAGALPVGTFEGFSLTASAKEVEIVDSGYCGNENENEGKNVTWTLDREGTLTISGSGDMSDFSFNNVPWYADRDNIKKVVIAEGVTSIGKGAFQYLLKLESVSIPNSVVSIGSEAFFVCEALADIAIPKSVTSIGDYAFSDCESLSSMIIPECVTSIGDSAFSSCERLSSITIPESVTSFGFNAFSGTPWLDAKLAENPLVIVNNILVDGRAASGDVTIPDSVTSIASYVFYANEEIESITIPNSVTSIADHAFCNCKKLESIIIPNSITSISDSAFHSCENLTSVKIPDSVTSIGYGAFSDCKSLTSVTIPDSVTSIDHIAFGDCEKLKSITIPASVKSIDDEAFGYYWNRGYKKYEDFTIKGYKGTAAETYAKKNGFEFIAIATPEIVDSGYCGNENENEGKNVTWTLDSEGTLTISGSGDMANFGVSNVQPWKDDKNKIKKIIIADGVTSIGYFAFDNCTSLSSVTIPNSVTRIDYGAFRHCTSLASVTIPDSITIISTYAFCDTSLTSITIPASVRRIDFESLGYYYDNDEESKKVDGFTIKGCKGAAAETYAKENGFEFIAIATPEIVDSGYCGNENENEGKNVTWTLDNVGTLTISGSGDMANFGISDFQPWKDYEYNLKKHIIEKNTIKKIIITDGVTSIGGYAFEHCDDLASITIPESVTSIGDHAFASCWSLASIIIPEGVASIDNYTFASCWSLASIIIPESVASIGNWAFYGCDNLESITIPNTVSNIGIYAFDGTAWLKAKQADDPLVVVNNILIDGYKATGDVTIPDNVTSIIDYAFHTCYTLESITIPNSVVSIGGCAFSSCTSLSSVTIPNSVTSIGYGVFMGCTSLASVTIPDSITSIDAYAFRDTSLTSITIPASVTSIGDEAFGYYNDHDVNEYKKVDGFTIKGYKGTAAETYASKNGFNFVPLSDNKYPNVKSEVKDGRFRIKWKPVPGAEKYGIALYQSGSWRVKVQLPANVTSYTSPKLKSGVYTIVVCAKINGKWDTSNIAKRAFRIIIK